MLFFVGQGETIITVSHYQFVAENSIYLPKYSKKPSEEIEFTLCGGITQIFFLKIMIIMCVTLYVYILPYSLT